MRSFHSISALYVSPRGSDANNGYAPEQTAPSVGPFRTIGAALNLLVELRRFGVMQPVTIYLRGGRYELGAPVDIKPGLGIVTIAAYAGEKPVLSGGSILGGVRNDSFNGVSCLSADVPDGVDFRDLFVCGKRASFTRYPETGELKITGCDNPSNALFAPCAKFTVDPAETAELGDLTGCTASIFHYWIDEHSLITAWDAEKGEASLRARTRFNLINDQPGVVLEDIACRFRNPGEWYFDRAARKVYCIPHDDSITAENAEFVYPRLDRLFNIAGTAENPVRNFTLRGLTIADTKSDYDCYLSTFGEAGDSTLFASDSQAVGNGFGTVNFSYAENCAVEDCVLTRLGLHAVVITDGCSSIAVRGNTMTDIGGGGVRIDGAKAGKDPAGFTHSCTVSDNTMLHLGRRHQAGCGVLLMNAFCCTVSHNEIGDLYYTGVSGGWVWGYTPSVSRDNLIEFNYIHDVGQGVLSDMGGVYLLGSQPGTVVRNNLIHDVYSRKYGGWALYTDEGSGCITLENNVCYNTSDNGYHQHYGRMNVVRNNIFAYAGRETLRVSRYETHLSILFENNILLTKKGAPVYGLDRRAIMSGTVASGRNLIWSEDGKPILWGNADNYLTLEGMQAAGMEEGSAVADPKFADPAHFDFTLSADSPALALGFAPIDISTVGPRK